MNDKFDTEGFLRNLHDWNRDVANSIAQAENISLTSAHWELINSAREYQKKFDISPEMRPFIKWIRHEISQEKASSLYLLKLFPGSPAKLISKIAGLPKPPNCI